MDEGNELQRARERLHKIEGALIGLGFRLQRLEEISDDVKEQMDTEIRPQIAKIARVNEIADAVAERLGTQQTRRFTFWQILGGWLVALAAVADAVSHIVIHT